MDKFGLLNRGVTVGRYLIISDLHFGYTAGDGGGVGYEQEYESLCERIRNVMISQQPETLIIAGDLFHSFGQIPDGVETHLSNLTRDLYNRGFDLICVEGNHDVISPDIIPYLRSTDEYHMPLHDVVVTHGHKTPDKEAETYIIGHLHPMLRIQGDKWPCHLYGCQTYFDSNVMILPPYTELGGTSVHAGYDPQINIPILEDGEPLSEYQPVIWDDKTETSKKFPKLGKMTEYI
jgi:hypothetical protein